MITGADRTLRLLEAQVGRRLEDVETPVVIVELDLMEANLRRLASYAETHGVSLWPHTKTHKSPEIGLRQLALGAGGLTVAKTGEAEVFHEAGAPRLLFHYPPVGRDRCDRLARLAAEGLDLTVAVDCPEAAEGLSDALRRHGAKASLLVELDVGLHRTGQHDAAGAVAVGQAVSKLPALELAGISAYPGHCRGDEATIRRNGLEADAILRETREAFLAAGLPCGRISGGSSPIRYMTHETCVNELRAGTYVFLDRNEEEPDGGMTAAALRIEVTVISNAAVPGQVIFDAGTKTLTSDTHDDGLYGDVVGMPEARVHDLNEEHGYLDVSAVPSGPPGIGDRLELIPNHACGCVNLHDGLLGVRDGVVERVIRVAGRGLVR
jgi:D-serine deaminase-like pyridoxal phosphate-dependent protein